MAAMYDEIPQIENGCDDEEEGFRMDSTSTDMEFDEEFEVLVNAFLRDMDYTSTKQAVFNIVYSIINAGLIALPYAAYLAGIPMFIVIVSIVSLISGYVSIMVIAMANEQRVRTLEDLAQCAFGPNGFILVCGFQLLFSLSLMCITLDIFAEIMTDVFSETSVTTYMLAHRRGQVIVGSILILPLCILKKSMSSMRWTSYFTVFTVAAALVGVVTTYATDVDISDTASTKRVITPKLDSAWSAILIVLFCYSYNQKVFMIYSCLRRRNSDRWAVAVKRANLIISVLYIVFGVFGYVSRDRIGEPMDTHDYFIDNRDENKAVFDVARIMVAFCLLLTIPVDCLVATTTGRRIVSRYQRSQLEVKLQKNMMCCSRFFKGGSMESGSFTRGRTTSDDVEEEINTRVRGSQSSNPSNTGNSNKYPLLAPAEQHNKPRSASGSKAYQKHDRPTSSPVKTMQQQARSVNSSNSDSSPLLRSQSNTSSQAGALSQPPVKKILKPSAPVLMPTMDAYGQPVAEKPKLGNVIGSLYRNIMSYSSPVNVTDMNTSINSRSGYMAEALLSASKSQDGSSNSAEALLHGKHRITNSTATDNSSSLNGIEGESYNYNNSGSYNNNNNNEIASILHSSAYLHSESQLSPQARAYLASSDRTISASGENSPTKTNRRSVSFVDASPPPFLTAPVTQRSYSTNNNSVSKNSHISLLETILHEAENEDEEPTPRNSESLHSIYNLQQPDDCHHEEDGAVDVLVNTHNDDDHDTEQQRDSQGDLRATYDMDRDSGDTNYTRSTTSYVVPDPGVKMNKVRTTSPPPSNMSSTTTGTRVKTSSIGSSGSSRYDSHSNEDKRFKEAPSQQSASWRSFGETRETNDGLGHGIHSSQLQQQQVSADGGRGRLNSLGDEDFKRTCPTLTAVFPAICLWAVMTGVCIIISKWIFIATVATITTVILLFLFPTMFYFRLGLASDFQAIPWCGVVPNRFFMTIVQVIGILMLLFEAGALIFNIIENGVAMEKHV